MAVYKDRLYLFSIDEVQKDWLNDPDRYIANAKRRLPSLPVSRCKTVEIAGTTKPLQDELKK